MGKNPTNFYACFWVWKQTQKEKLTWVVGVCRLQTLPLPSLGEHFPLWPCPRFTVAQQAGVCSGGRAPGSLSFSLFSRRACSS